MLANVNNPASRHSSRRSKPCIGFLRAQPDVPPMQIIVLDKLDYCATLRNLDSVKGHKNLKAGISP